MSHIEVVYDRQEYETTTPRPDDQWDRASTAATNHIEGIRLVSEAKYRDITVSIDVQPDTTYFLVWADYSTGDSFGTDDNCVEFIDLYTTHEAAELAAQQLQEGGNYTRSYTRNDGTDITVHIPWDGYFESLNDINITEVKLV